MLNNQTSLFPLLPQYRRRPIAFPLKWGAKPSCSRRVPDAGAVTVFPPSLFCYATQALSGQSCRAVQGPCARNSSTFNYLQQRRTPRGAGCREGWRLLVCEKQSWALEGAWAFANGRRSLQRAGGRAGERGPGRARRHGRRCWNTDTKTRVESLTPRPSCCLGFPPQETKIVLACARPW